jgi:MinD superfamily P-loop ATPase
MMKIAVLSGKGGTGKTLISVNMAVAAGKSVYIDCDVEEPNGHLFFKPENIRETDILVNLPSINQTLCAGCRKCVDFCKFHALAFINYKPYLFDDVCHSCGGCALFCPEHAIAEKAKSIGKVQVGSSGNVTVKTGVLNEGEASGIPIIKKLLEESVSEKVPVFIDCPPGSACIVMESIRDADYCILVAEPTLFGVHNLNMVYELVTLFGKRFGVVLNKCLGDENPAHMFCVDKNIPIIGSIPFDPDLGALSSDALIAAREKDMYWALFASIVETVMKEAV